MNTGICISYTLCSFPAQFIWPCTVVSFAMTLQTSLGFAELSVIFVVRVDISVMHCFHSVSFCFCSSTRRRSSAGNLGSCGKRLDPSKLHFALDNHGLRSFSSHCTKKVCASASRLWIDSCTAHDQQRYYLELASKTSKVKTETGTLKRTPPAELFRGWWHTISEPNGESCSRKKWHRHYIWLPSDLPLEIGFHAPP